MGDPERLGVARERIRATRPPKPWVDPWTPHGWLLERERLPGGAGVQALTVFLAGKECPYTCVFCDLWRYTLDGPTPSGALPVQLRRALLATASDLQPGGTLKLYNASNFFDPGAVPDADIPTLVELCRPFDRVVVESHPRLLGRRCRRLADCLEGRLQVAMGLETIHPQAQPRLGKGASLDDFTRAAETLAKWQVEMRAFVLVGAPFVPPSESVSWAVRSVAFALERGAVQVALIPVRGGNGELERLAALGQFERPSLEQLEEAFDRALQLPGKGVVTADTWDLELFAPCDCCRAARVARLERMSLGGEVEARVPCRCAES